MTKFKRLESRQWVPHTFEKVAALFEDPNALSALTPPEYQAKIICDGKTENGAKVTITIKKFGVPVRWVSGISDVERTDERFSFVDKQLSGPFAHWKHTHVIEAGDKNFEGRSGQKISMDEGGTWIVDSVEYKMPFSIAGKIAHKLFAKGQLESMFAFRKKAILKLLNQEA